MKIKDSPNQNKAGKATKDGLLFIKEVAKYFMDFLETDFHKRRNPKRSVQLRNASNLLIGLNLSKYPSFNALVWKAVVHGKEFLKLKMSNQILFLSLRIFGSAISLPKYTRWKETGQF